MLGLGPDTEVDLGRQVDLLREAFLRRPSALFCDIDDTLHGAEVWLDEMPQRERAARAALMRAQVRSWTSRDWLRAQLADLDEAHALAHPPEIAS